MNFRNSMSSIFLICLFTTLLTDFSKGQNITSQGNNYQENVIDYILISEILYNSNNSNSDQFIELYNPTSVEVNLSGYEIELDGRLLFMIPSGFKIAPLTYFTITKSSNATTFPFYYGFDADLYLNWSSNFNNGGGKVDLYNSTGQFQDFVAYGNRQNNIQGWGNIPKNNSGVSTCRLDGNPDTNTAADWKECFNGGDPNVQPSVFTWNGNSNSEWTNPNNWEQGSVPGLSPDFNIFIPITSNNPVLNSSLLISESQLDVSDGVIFTISSNGSLIFDVNSTVTSGSNSIFRVLSGATYINRSNNSPTVEIEQLITGSKGWRMIASPVLTNFGSFLDGNFVTQGFTGSDYPSLQTNLLWWDESDAGTTLQGWRTPSNISENLALGRGYFHYIFNGAGIVNSELNYSDQLPLTLSIQGQEPNLSGSSYSFTNLSYTPRDTALQGSGTDEVYIDRIVADEGWNFIGNPTASTLDWNATGWTKTNISETIYVWDPQANNGNGDYLVWNGSTGSLGSGKISPLQGFWVQATSANPQLSFTNAAKTTAGSFKGKQKSDCCEISEIPAVKFTLSTSNFRKDLWLSFSENGKKSNDQWDAFQLETMSDTWMTFYSKTRGSDNVALAINHLPIDQNGEITVIELITAAYKEYIPVEGEFTLSWERFGNWTDGLNLYLQDNELKIKNKIDDKADSLSFYYSSPVLNEKKSYKASVNGTVIPNVPAQIVFDSQNTISPKMAGSVNNSSSNSRFSVVVSEDEMNDFISLNPTLYQNYPNPFNPVTTIQFSLPESSQINIQIFDVLGRVVSNLAEGTYSAGVHRVTWDAGRLSSGVYFYRLSSNGTNILTEKMILLK